MSAWDIPDKTRFTLAEVAEITGFPAGVLAERCRKGEIWHNWLGKTRTFSRAQVQALLDSTEVRPDKKAAADPELARIEDHRRRVADKLARKRAAA